MMNCKKRWGISVIVIVVTVLVSCAFVCAEPLDQDDSTNEETPGVVIESVHDIYAIDDSSVQVTFKINNYSDVGRNINVLSAIYSQDGRFISANSYEDTLPTRGYPYYVSSGMFSELSAGDYIIKCMITETGEKGFIPICEDTEVGVQIPVISNHEDTGIKYGILLGVGQNSDFSSSTKMVKMLTSDGEEMVYEVDEDSGEQFSISNIGRIVAYRINEDGSLDSASCEYSQQLDSYTMTKNGIIAGHRVSSDVVVFDYDPASDVINDAASYVIVGCEELKEAEEFLGYYVLDNEGYIAAMYTLGMIPREPGDSDIEEEEVLSEIKYGILLNVGQSSGSFSSTKMVKMLTSDGEEMVYEVNEDSENRFSTNSIGKVVAYQVNGNGAVNSVACNYGRELNDANMGANGILVGHMVSTNVVVFDYDADSDDVMNASSYEIAGYEELKEAQSINGYFVTNDDGEIVAVYTLGMIPRETGA